MNIKTVSHAVILQQDILGRLATLMITFVFTLEKNHLSARSKAVDKTSLRKLTTTNTWKYIKVIQGSNALTLDVKIFFIQITMLR